MTSLEIDALQLSISNSARVLYMLYLQPQADKNTASVTIHYRDVMTLLNGKSKKFTLGRQINVLLKELHHAGLISINKEQSFTHSLNGQAVHLPLMNLAQLSATQTSHAHAYKSMSVDWRPDMQTFTQIAQLIGLIDKGFSADELGEFIAYWLGAPEKQFSEYQWTQKFVLNIKLRRQRFPISKEQTKVGHQWVTPQANIEIDDNVKLLVQKYSEKQ